MTCTSCKRTQTLASCPTSLVIGTISSANTEVNVYLQRKSTGRLFAAITTTDADGLVTVDVSTKTDFFQPNETYEVWVVLTSATFMYERETITLSATTASCLLMTFQNTTAIESQTLSICS